MILSNEMIISALLSNSTNTAAAEELKISESYLYKRMRSEAFQKAFSEAKAVVFRTCLEEAQRNVMKAVTTMTEIMNDRENSAQLRLSAAQAVVTTVTRLQNSAAKERMENDPFKWF